LLQDRDARDQFLLDLRGDRAAVNDVCLHWNY
jgi:hypothetical protein